MVKRLRRKHLFDYAWKKNPNALYVGRGKGCKWGNPFKVKDFGIEVALKAYRTWLLGKLSIEPDFLEPLRGKDLVCFCPLMKDGEYCNCHADILISMSNNISMEEVKNENIKACQNKTEKG